MSTNIRLDARLLAVCSYVLPGSVVADIGADHGFLICHLVKSGLAKRGFACEANPQPLARAEQTIRGNCLSHSIDTVLTNGLTGLPYGEIDTVIISGMGGDLISRILLEHPWTRDTRFRYILQPMTKAENLRRKLFENGFTISSETAIISVNKVYTVMCVSYTDRSIEYDDVSCYIGCLPERGDFPSRLFLERTALNLDKKAKGLLKSGNPEKAEKCAELAAKIRRRIPDNDLSDRGLL